MALKNEKLELEQVNFEDFSENVWNEWCDIEHIMKKIEALVKKIVNFL